MDLKYRRHWPLVAGTLATIGLTIAVVGDWRVIPYTVVPDDTDAATGYEVTSGEPGELFSLDTVHSITIEIDEEDQENMFLTYQETDEKEYYPAVVNIDGTVFEDAEIRLKGNSSLNTAFGGPGSNPNQTELDPSGMPYMVKLNDDYQGYSQFALRTNFKDAAYLHEVLGYMMLEDMGITAPHAAYTGVDINDSGEVLYVVAEVVNEDFVARYFGDEDAGDLIKAQPGAGLNYQGEDPTQYADTFELQTNVNESDLYDLIEFMQFIDESDDTTFENELSQYMELDTLLGYLAFCNVVVNMDSFPGNTNNHYYYQGTDGGAFTLVPWDLNEIFGSFWHLGGQAEALDLFYETEARAQGQQGPPQFQPQGPPLEDQKPQLQRRFEFDDLEFDDLLEYPGYFKMPMDFVSGNMGGGSFNQSNPLVTRVMDNTHFQALYVEIVEQLMEDWFNTETLTAEIDALTSMVLEANETRDFLTDLAAYQQGIESDKQFIEARIEFLETELLQYHRSL